jgi:class II lanthipeptide synthase
MKDPIENWSIDREVAFGSVFAGLVSRARADLVVGSGWTTSVADRLGEELRARLSRISAPALLTLFRPGEPDFFSETDGEMSTTRYRRFVRAAAVDDLAALRAAFPVLGDLLDMTCRQWTRTSQDLIDRVSDARAEFELRLGFDAGDPITTVETGLGDRHRGGYTVARLCTASGRQAIYKPRSMAPEARFYEIWSAFRAQRGDTAATPIVVDRGDAGFMEYLEPAPVRDQAAYWRRAGELAGLLHLCAAEDMHYENVIAAGDQAVAFDLECINQPNRFGEREDRLEFVTDSVLATGLFPNWFVGAGADGSDSAGLFAGQSPRPVETMSTWIDLGTDHLRQVSVPYTRMQGGNAPQDERGDPVRCDQRSLFEGLEAAFELGPSLVEGAGSWGPSRFLSRPTRVFAQARSKLLEVDALQDRRVFESMSRELPEMEPEFEALLGARRTALIEADAAALQRLDIPLHLADGASLRLDGGGTIDALFDATAVDHRRERIRRLSPAGTVLQRQLVTLAVEQFEHRVWQRAADPVSIPEASGSRLREEAVEAARHLGEELVGLAVETHEGPAWLEVDQRTPMRGTAHQTNLYAGSDGIALFFAALAHVTGEEQWSEHARRTFGSIPSPLDDTAWVERGWAGRVYSRSVGAVLLEDDSLAGDAQTEASRGWPRPPGANDKLDVLGGWSGVLLALLASRSAGIDCGAIPEELTAWLAQEVGRRLESPVHQRATIRMGFAHGTTGVSFSLALAARELGDESARVVSVRLAEIEEQRIAKRGGVPGALSGLDATKEPTRSWCWGTGGYAMARAQPAWRSVHGERSHLDGAIEILLSPTRERSHACCGEAGQLMALTEIAFRGRIPVGVTGADSLAAALISDARGGGSWQFYNETSLTTPGLFWGIAGVGFALLHYARPSVVPNFLLFAPVGGFSVSPTVSASDR